METFPLSTRRLDKKPMTLGIRSYLPEFTATNKIADAAAKKCLAQETWINYLLFIWENLDECWNSGIERTWLKKGREDISNAMPTIYSALRNAVESGSNDIDISYGGQTLRLSQTNRDITLSWPGSNGARRLTDRTFLNLANIIEEDILKPANSAIYSLTTRQAINDIILQHLQNRIVPANQSEILDFEERYT